MDREKIIEIATNSKYSKTNKILGELGSIAVKNKDTLEKKYKKDTETLDKLRRKARKEFEENDSVIKSIQKGSFTAISAEQKAKIKREVKEKMNLNKKDLPKTKNRFVHLFAEKTEDKGAKKNLKEGTNKHNKGIKGK